jgi:hypothetical protein
MSAHFGVTLGDVSLTAPAGGYVNEASSEETINVAEVRDEDGNIVVAVPKLMVTETQTIKGKGDPVISAVVEGAFTSGTVKITSAKGSESNEEFPDFEITGKKFSG